MVFPELLVYLLSGHVGQGLAGIYAVGFPRILTDARDGVRTRPHSFNAAAAGKFFGRFVESRSGHSTM